MISSKSRLVVPYGLKTLLEGISRAVLKTNPSNITQFAAVYFKELTVFREGNTSLDIKDLVKQFHQVKVEKWSEGATLEKKLERIKESEGTSVVLEEPTRMEKCTDTEEDSVAGLQFINKTTQFPLDRAEYLQPEETAEAVPGPPSKPATPKATTPPPSPSPAPVSAEFTYVPADPAQFAAQMLAIATSEAGQPPPYPNNMWTLYCLTDMNQQSRPSPPPAPVPFPQATLYLSNSKDPQFLQNSPKITSTYVMMEDSKKTSPPPFILVGSNVQETQDWKPLPGHTVVSQSDGIKRYATVQVPIAVATDQKLQKHTQSPQNASPTSGHDGPRPQSPVFLSVAFPVEDVAKKGSGSGDKHTPFGSYGIAGEITVTSAHVRRAEP